jgi:hypothetical protein
VTGGTIIGYEVRGSDQEVAVKALCLFASFGVFVSTVGAAQTAPQPAPPALGKALRNAVTNPSAKNCKSDDPDRVVVCGRSRHPYRIDPDVLAAERAVEAPPVRAPLTADDAHMACIGADCGTGGVVPVIGMVLVAAGAIAMAADGDDWRNAFRTHEDEYQAYQDAKARQRDKPHIEFLGGLIKK